MTNKRRLVSLIAIASVVALTGCSEPIERIRSAEIYGPPVLGDWIEIEGRWDVAFDHGDDGALLQPARELSWVTDDNPDPGSENAGASIWVDNSTGTTQWSRDDLADPFWGPDGALLAFVGDGADRTVDSIDIATGESLWSVPESDLGECSGWSRIGAREIEPDAAADAPDADATDSDPDTDAAPDTDSPTETTDRDEEPTYIPVMVAADECSEQDRVLLSELDPQTGATTPVLTGSGTLFKSWIDGELAMLTWDRSGAKLQMVDLGTSEVTRTLDLPASLLTEESFVAGSSELNSATYLDFRRGFDNDILITLVWDAGSEGQLPYNRLRVDTKEMTAEVDTDARFCLAEVDTALLAYTWNTTVPYCIVLGTGEQEAQVAVGSGDDLEQWPLPTVGVDRTNWDVVTCIEDDEERSLLLAPAPDARVRAYDLRTGEVMWSIGTGSPDTLMVSAARSDANRAIVLSGAEQGAQTLQTIRLCTGEVLTERPVEGAYLGGDLIQIGDMVTVPLESTTLLAIYRDRGIEPDGDAATV